MGTHRPNNKVQTCDQCPRRVQQKRWIMEFGEQAKFLGVKAVFPENKQHGIWWYVHCSPPWPWPSPSRWSWKGPKWKGMSPPSCFLSAAAAPPFQVWLSFKKQLKLLRSEADDFLLSSPYFFGPHSSSSSISSSSSSSSSLPCWRPAMVTAVKTWVLCSVSCPGGGAWPLKWSWIKSKL